MASWKSPRGDSLRNWLESRFNLTEIFSLLTHFGLFPAELDTKKPLKEAITEALRRERPSYARWPRVLGILCVILFLFLVVSGVMLAFYYQPTVGEAYASVTTLVRDVDFGWFVHQIHGWAARLFLLILLVRMWRFFYQGTYKTPREAAWIIAVLTFLAATHADFTGRLLLWNESGYWTAIRGLEILYSLPLLGPLFAFLVGGTEVDSMVLVRFYFLHVVLIPGVLFLLLYLNFSSVRRVGLSAGAGPTRSGADFFRSHLYNLLILAVVLLGTLVTLATLAPEPYLRVADPFVTPAGVRPPWYLLASHAFLESFPTWIPRWTRGFLLEMMLLFTLLLPFLDRSTQTGFRRRRLALILGSVVLLLWLYFSWLGWQMEAGL